MTDKQIIIDEQMENLNNLATQQLKRIEEEKRQIEHIAKTHLVETFDMQKEIDKLKKQLKAKEQECEELKEKLKEMNEVIRTETTRCSLVNSLKTELDQLKAENDKLKKQRQADKGLITSTGKQNYQLIQEYDKLKTALTEIKEIAITGLEGFCPKCSRKECEDNNCIETAIRDILQKISEVE